MARTAVRRASTSMWRERRHHRTQSFGSDDVRWRLGSARCPHRSRQRLVDGGVVFRPEEPGGVDDLLTTQWYEIVSVDRGDMLSGWLWDDTFDLEEGVDTWRGGPSGDGDGDGD